jgi:hypothetical protein
LFDLIKYSVEISRLKNDFSYLQRCSVALVGNAQSIFGTEHGAAIDNHDVVVRMNAGWVVDARCQGSRTDILCLSMGLDRTAVQDKFGNPQVIWMTPKRRMMHASLRKFGVYYYPKRCWRILKNDLSGSRPSTGAMAVDLFCRQLSVVNITLYGFDFKKTKTFYLEQDHVGPHRYDLEEQFVTAVVSSHGRVV